jgi:hypothetical protein
MTEMILMMWFDEEEFNADCQGTAAVVQLARFIRMYSTSFIFTNFTDLFIDYLKPLF